MLDNKMCADISNAVITHYKYIYTTDVLFVLVYNLDFDYLLPHHLLSILTSWLYVFAADAPPGGEAGKTDTMGSTGSARKRGGGAKKAMQANKSALRAPRALCCLTLSNPIRMAALALVEWKYPFIVSVYVVYKLSCVNECTSLTSSSRPLIFSFSSPSLPTVWPWVSPSRTLMMTPMLPITNWWVYNRFILQSLKQKVQVKVVMMWSDLITTWFYTDKISLTGCSACHLHMF